jgi:PHD - plant homeodomain finger protein
VYEVFKSTNDAHELLQSWTRRELIQLICFETGKERKYTGLPKPKMISQLLKLISRKSSTVNFVQDANKENPRAKNATFEGSVCDNAFCISPFSEGEDNCKRCKFEGQGTKNHEQERNLDELVDTNVPNGLKRKATESKLKNSGDKDVKVVRSKRKANTEISRDKDAKLDQLLCDNVACRATLSMGDVYCKRCSCCVCCKFDDNKDPSLWLVCSSDPPFTDESCGATCHLRCALKHEKSGIRKKSSCSEELDGAFYCVFCGKVNSLLG